MSSLLSSMGNVFLAAEYLKTHPRARQVFDAIEREQAVAGWYLAKTLTIDPDELEPILMELGSLALIQSDAPGLDAFFFLSDVGFRIRSLAT